MRIGIDATNIGGGGGITHLKEFLNHIKFDEWEFDSITVYASTKVIDQILDHPAIIKKTSTLLNSGLLNRLKFQLFQFDKILQEECDILFSLTGDYVGKFKPVVAMSRNMLLYERDIWKEIGQPKEIMRFWLNYLKQKRCFRNAEGIIFISNYAQEIISSSLNLSNKEIRTIHHGISPRFMNQQVDHLSADSYSIDNPFTLLYVSTVHVYKNQWNVVEAVARLREKGIPVQLELVGGVIFEAAGKRLKESIEKFDSDRNFIKWHGDVPYNKIDEFYKQADGIVYASTCENMPNILIESMASGLPIACSNKEPMPEFLKNNGFYFNAKEVESIQSAIEEMLSNREKRSEYSSNNIEEIKSYNWGQTSKDTMKFIIEIWLKNN